MSKAELIAAVLVAAVALALVAVPAVAQERGPDLTRMSAVMVLGDEASPALAAPLWYLCDPAKYQGPMIPTSLGDARDAIRYQSRLTLLVYENGSGAEMAVASQVVSDVFGLLNAGVIFNPFDECRSWVTPYMDAQLYGLLCAGTGILNLQLSPVAADTGARGYQGMLVASWEFQ